MTAALIGVGILAVVVIALEILGRVPAKYRDLTTVRIRSLVDLLLQRGLADAELIIRAADPIELRVIKVMDETDHFDIKLHITEQGAAYLGRDVCIRWIEQWGRIPLVGREGAVEALGPTAAPQLVAITESFKNDLAGSSSRWVAHLERIHPDVNAHVGRPRS